MKLRTYILFLFLIINCYSQSNSKLLETIINNDAILKNIIDKKEIYKPQIIYTQIDRDKNNDPIFTNHTYLLDSTNYFYCASLVKLPCSILALEKINELNVPGLSKNSYMFTDRVYPCQATCLKDSSSESGYPTLATYIRKMMLVSDNYSYSRVYEFLNPKYIQKKMSAYGYPQTRIVHRFDPPCKGEANLTINPVRFLDEKMNVLYTQEADRKPASYDHPIGSIVLGQDVYNKKKKLISEKKDFTHSNFIPLSNIHSILKRLLFHDHLSEKNRFHITKEDRDFLVQYIGMYPRESRYPTYDPKTYNDAYKKYFMYGNKLKTIDSDSMRVFNIIGYSYGFLIDCAYIVNFKRKTEFMLSSVVYTNAKNSFGSGSYEYDKIGIPFLKELSTEIYRHELTRKKNNLPDLTEFDIYKNYSDTTKPKKVTVNGMITVNGNTSSGIVIIKSINKVYSYYPDVAADNTGKFSINLLAGEAYELEFNVKDSPPIVIDIDTKNNKANDTINVFAEFMSPHLDKIIKTKQDSLFLEMLKAYNKVSLNTYADKYGDKKVEGLTYKVQIGAYKFIENFNYSSVAGMPIIIRETFDDYITRFTMGNYATFNEANELVKKLKATNLKDAFIFAVYNGKRLYLNEVIEKGLVK